ncbi:MAG: chloride channel protein [Desulfobacteraceae bacterium]|nr:MAG: chloride channel protein [Desulfobacteraceae bacterium]
MAASTKGDKLRRILYPVNRFNVPLAGKWALKFIVVGLVAGLGSIIFHYLCQLGIHYFMDFMAGYRPPQPMGEPRLLPPTIREFNRWVLLFLPAIGGIFSGWLVYTFAPEAEGHGTDAAIDAYHNKGGFIRARVPFVKVLASSITMTTGGSGGREGPIAQIGAGFGSYLATKFKLSNRERRIMMAAGIGAGVGSIFRAPLAGALFAAEVLYRDPDFESEVIIPAGITSVVAYCLFCLKFGWGSLFESPPFKFQNPLELGPYLVLALILVGAGILYIQMFYGTANYFRSIKFLPNHLKPAVGGLLTGMVGFFWPQCLAFGYGFVQKALFSELTIGFLLALAFGKILTTSFTIGSGGSGGVFGPSMVIGGALGGAVGQVFHNIMPALVSQPGAFVVVGMAGFFTAVSNTPISTIIIVSEMTNSYHLLLPSLLVCSITYMASRPWTIFHSQVKSKLDSPAHAGDFFVDVLESFKVSDLMHLIKPVRMIPQDMFLLDFKQCFGEMTQHYFPVGDEHGRMIGIFSINDVRGVLFAPEIEHLVVMKDIATDDIIKTTPSEDLHSILKKFTTKNIDSLPVVVEDNPTQLLGMINRREVISFYNQKVEKIKLSRSEK